MSRYERFSDFMNATIPEDEGGTPSLQRSDRLQRSLNAVILFSHGSTLCGAGQALEVHAVGATTPLVLSVGAGMLATRGARAFLRRRISANLLRNVIAAGVGVLVFLFGTYVVLRVVV